MGDAMVFWQEWVPLAYEIAFKGTIFNWGAVLSANFKATIATSPWTDKPERSNLFMYDYLVDKFCSQHLFPIRKWTWNPIDPLVHVYFDLLWDFKYRSSYEKICNYFLIPLQRLLTYRPTFFMSEDAWVTVGNIRDRYITDKYTYIQIYGVTKAPHIISKYVTDHMVLTKIAYQTYVHGVGATLTWKKKDLWPHLPLTIWDYSFNVATEAEKLAETIQAFHFGEERFQRHDPKAVVWSYMSVYGVPCPYTHTTFSDEEPGTRALNWKNVHMKLARRRKVIVEKAKTPKASPKVNGK